MLKILAISLMIMMMVGVSLMAIVQAEKTQRTQLVSVKVDPSKRKNNNRKKTRGRA